MKKISKKNWEILNSYGITPDNLTVGGYLHLRGTSITTLPDNLTVGGSLDLRGTSITTLPANLTVGSSLHLRGTSITTLPANLTVGGYLDLRGTSITTLPANLTVGGSLYLSGGEEIYRNDNVNLSWQNGKYIKVDGLFTEVVNKRGNVYRVKELNKEKVFYLVTDGNGKWSHGGTLKQAREDLIYKLSDGVDKDAFKEIPKTKKMNISKCIQVYRTITGSCAFGVKSFVEEMNIDKGKKYSINDIIKQTKGHYGHESFVRFFK